MTARPLASDRTIAWMRTEIERRRRDGTLAPALCDALMGILDLHGVASEQARKEDAFLQAWALNFRIENFTMPNESGARTLLPGLTAAINQLALGFSTDNDAKDTE